MKLIIWLLVFISMLGVVSAADFNYTINLSSLSFTDSKVVVLSGITNLTINMTYGQYLSGDLTKTFIVNVTDITININVPENSSALNTTSMVSIVGDNPIFNGNITFDFFILDDTPPITDFIQVDINEFSYSTCDFLLPRNITKDLVISGVEGQVIQTLYNNKFFDFPDEFTIPAQNFSVQTVNIHLNNLSVGEYRETIRFNVISEFDNVTFNFEILACVIPFPKLSELIKACSIENKTIEEFITCERLKAEQQRQVYEAILEANEPRVVQNRTTKFVNFTERVPVLDLNDKDLLNSLKDLPATIRQLITENRQQRSELTDKDNQISNLQNEKSSQVDEFKIEIRDTVESLSEDNIRKQNTINYYADKFIKKSTIWWSIFWVVLIILLVWAYIKLDENTWW